MSRKTAKAEPKADAGNKNRSHLFKKGQSGNPNGTKQGSRHKTSLAIEALLDGEAEKLTRKAVEAALNGDMTALRICIDRICPPRKERAISFEAPELKTPADALSALAVIAQGLANGELTPSEAVTSSSVIATFVKAVETAQLEARIAKLEATAEKDRS